MGDPINPNVAISFDDPATEAAVMGMGIDPDNLFVFAYAQQDPEAGCKQVKQAVLAKSEDEFFRLVPGAKQAGVLPVPTSVFGFINPDPEQGPVFLDDCCAFSRNVQIFAMAAPDQAGEAPRVQQWDSQSVVMLQDDRNPDKFKRRFTFLHVGSRDVKKDCAQL